MSQTRHFNNPILKKIHEQTTQTHVSSETQENIKLPPEVKEDFLFHSKMLELAHNGISMNLLTYRKIDILYRADAFPAIWWLLGTQQSLEIPNSHTPPTQSHLQHARAPSVNHRTLD